MKTLWVVAVAVFALNIPFGYWRSKVKAFSRQWFLSVHIPVPFVIALRFLAGLGWRLVTFPVLVGAFFFGQLTGGIVRRLYAGHSAAKQKG
ncbi:MAG: hypothetical protein M1491_10240 [Deltaproteobacteria bacterium]|nr:hypothetical protein [Deltaproteobacteria bacterium]